MSREPKTLRRRQQLRPNPDSGEPRVPILTFGLPRRNRLSIRRIPSSSNTESALPVVDSVPPASHQKGRTMKPAPAQPCAPCGATGPRRSRRSHCSCIATVCCASPAGPPGPTRTLPSLAGAGFPSTTTSRRSQATRPPAHDQRGVQPGGAEQPPANRSGVPSGGVSIKVRGRSPIVRNRALQENCRA
jgi:hypothetical protein